jgi:hypothetical protein
MKPTGLTMMAIGLALLAPLSQADWTPAQRLTWTSGESYDPAVAIGPGNAIHVVWRDFTPGNREIYYKRSTDGGIAWTSAQRLTWTAEESRSPAIAVDSSNAVHVVWYEHTYSSQKIYYKGSTDGGVTWGAAQRLAWTSTHSLYPAIAVDSTDAVHVVWEDHAPGNADIYYKQSSDEGITWSAAQRLTWTSGSSFKPDIAIDSSNAAHVVWEDYTPADGEVYYKGSTDSGATWGTAQRLTWTSGMSTLTALATDSSNGVHSVWEDYTPGTAEIYYKVSTDSGATWGAAYRLTWTSGASNYPAVAIDSVNAIHVVWEDYTPPPGYSEIYYKYSPDGGTTWNAAQRLTWTPGYSNAPAIAVDSGDAIHLFWVSDTPGNFEVYYKKGT